MTESPMSKSRHISVKAHTTLLIHNFTSQHVIPATVPGCTRDPRNNPANNRDAYTALEMIFYGICPHVSSWVIIRQDGLS